MMSCILYIILVFLLFLACALSALTQLSHRRTTDVKELAPQRTVHIRILSVCILVFTLTAFICREGGGFGFLLWAGLLSVSACCVALVLGWWPRLLVPLARLMSHSAFLLPLMPLSGPGKSPD
ncbi:hypothetical protein HK11_07725 [Acetobacter sp. DmW_043]|uniref:DUF3325 domain-containing protein n=1 Tax=Acetobacter sp. DmW_043 TaxID=1670658 RepID=UPI000A398875|nr:DUF3325 domain-containing protein [Acetobacter sp. DmW_043]OUI88165.1 hypothetical protein HK11_07725 [Acetobacter sp. DmW_043]